MKTLMGNILKMKTSLLDEVFYQLPIGNSLVDLNDLIGEKLILSFTGTINDIVTGERIKKSYGQGYSYKSFSTLARCDFCILSPERCHYEQGTCREPSWAEDHCMVPHVVYLANTGQVKVGITRESQIPTRFMDQGASYALPILRVSDRKSSGIIEAEIKKEVSDKTNWRKMLQGGPEEVDLIALREVIFDQHGDLLDSLAAEDLDEEMIKINYPVREYPEKVKSLSFDKTPTVKGRLMGIKGQYLIFDCGVINLRKFQGYEIELTLAG